MKNICIITSSYPRTEDDSINAGVFVKDFAERLVKKGNKVFIITPNKKGEKDQNPQVPVCFFPTIGGETELTSLNPANPLDFFKLVFLIINGFLFTFIKLFREKPDEIIAMWALPSGLYAWSAWLFFRIPYFTWALGSDIWGAKKYPCGKYFLKKILKNSKIVFADGYILADDVKLISGRECHFLPSVRKLNRDCRRKEIDLNLERKNFLFIGRYHANKGIDFLLDSIAEIPPKERQSFFFHIFGGGPLEDLIHQKCRDYSLEDCVIINRYADPPTVVTYLERCDCLIIPSRIESIPLILSDAIQMRCPVIVTDVGDMGKLIRKYKVGEVVTPLDKKSMVQALRRMITRKRSDYLHHFNAALQDFSVSGSVDTFLTFTQSNLD